MFQKIAEASGNLVGKKIADKVTKVKVSISSPQSNLEMPAVNQDIKMPKERKIYIYIYIYIAKR